MAGLAHANGSQYHSDMAGDHITGHTAIITLDSLYPWPGHWSVQTTQQDCRLVAS